MVGRTAALHFPPAGSPHPYLIRKTPAVNMGAVEKALVLRSQAFRLTAGGLDSVAAFIVYRTAQEGV